MTPALQAERLYRFYHAGDDETLALQGVDLEVAPGEVVAVTGPSGSGKSTLLACLAGLDEPDGGVVTVCGERLTRRPEAERADLRARSIGLMYQQTNLVGHLDVQANVELAQQLAGARPGRPSAHEVLAQAAIDHRAHARPSELSGGELARAALSVALANDPAVILADEPTGELDGQTAERVIELLRARAAAGAGVLIVTHSPQVAARADREIRLVDGRVTA